jgi:hypothetical protein
VQWKGILGRISRVGTEPPGSCWTNLLQEKGGTRCMGVHIERECVRGFGEVSLF